MIASRVKGLIGEPPSETLFCADLGSGHFRCATRFVRAAFGVGARSFPLFAGFFGLDFDTGVGLETAGRSTADDGRGLGSGRAKGSSRLGGIKRSCISAGVEAGRWETGTPGSRKGSGDSAAGCLDMGKGVKNGDADISRDVVFIRSATSSR